MLAIWLIPALLFIALDWAAVGCGWGKTNYATKPLALIFLIIWFVTTNISKTHMIWFGLGLFFSLIGDVFLLFSFRYFIFGLAAFFLAHAAYVVGFTAGLPPVAPQFWFLLSAVLCLWVTILVVLVKNLHQNQTHHKMIVPVGMYAAAISAMLLFAVWTLFRPDWTPAASGLAASGAILFFASDLLLALDRFVRPFPFARLWVRITYHLGQLAISAGAAAAALAGINHF